MNYEGQGPTNIVGSFNISTHEDFDNGLIMLNETFLGNYGLNAVDDIEKICKDDVFYEQYKELLIGDVLNEQFEDRYLNLFPAKLEQYMENSRKELILGKYFSICISGIITMSIGVILSITSLFFVKNSFTIYDNVIFNMTPITIVLTIIILIFYTLFISGLCIAIASFTKTFKEAQSALTPISLITCVPMFLSMLNINLNGILNFIPIVNHTIVINDILTGTINTNNILITIISSTIYIIILISLISKIYKSEKILFN